MVGIKTMDSLPSLREIMDLVKANKLKAGKWKTSPMSMVGFFERIWNFPQPIEPGIIDKIDKLISCIS